MKANNIRIADLKGLFVEKRMLMKKGSTRTISLLKNRNIHFLQIQSHEIEHHHAEDSSMPEKVEELQSNVTLDVPRLYPNYVEVLAELSTDIRYGHALKSVEDINYVRNLFEKYMKNVHYREMLIALERHDNHSYMHAIDVFTLCTLFAKQEDIPNLEHCAIGFLFHDIGKLKVVSEIEKKGCRLSNKEFDNKKKQTQDSYEIFCELELESVAYLAKLHHEHIVRTGYTEELTSAAPPREVSILQLIDRYSVITLKKAYNVEIGAAEAITTLYKEEHLFDKKLLDRFVDFIGIYPENAIVLLTDGSYAIVESVNNMYPLMPIIKRLDTYKSFILPVDSRLNIQKMLSLYIGKPEQIFFEFWQYSIICEVDMIDSYYQKLKEQYGPFECFTKIFIPTWKIFNIMKDHEVIDEIRLREVHSKLKNLLNNSEFQLRKDNKKMDVIIILVKRESRTSVPIQLIEGLFQTKGIYPFLLDVGTNEDELLEIAMYCNASAICVIDKEFEPIQCQGRKLNLYFIGEHQLENFIFSFAGEDYRNVDMELKLKDYEAVKKLLV
ncbi:HD-GYP domain-containing protein [Lysinibacillus sp. NPDC097287]|uniref:HD-GYP domain-containing protein n=1 Tax=Lysinibacillus sp. NPDC097287 TaxID=3364144 RepID=UPI0037FDF00E